MSTSPSRATRITFARSLAEVLGGRVREHEKFGTAVVLYGEGERVDVVTARTEFYDAPAALPTVEHASIREDLFRRDFTINAMAASLKGADFGRLVDPFGGRHDLERRTLRVLHNLSFIDDPTRIFRGACATRTATASAWTTTQPGSRGRAIDLGLVGDLSSARLRDELVALLDERERGALASCASSSSEPIERSIHTSPPTPRRSSCATACARSTRSSDSGSRRGGSASSRSRAA